MAWEEYGRREIVKYRKKKNLRKKSQENKFVLCKGEMTLLCCSKVIRYIKRNIGNNENPFLEE